MTCIPYFAIGTTLKTYKLRLDARHKLSGDLIVHTAKHFFAAFFVAYRVRLLPKGNRFT